MPRETVYPPGTKLDDLFERLDRISQFKRTAKVGDVMDHAIRIFSKRHVAERIVDASYRARRFVFDDEGSMFVGKFISEFHDLIVRNLEFALPPYPTCYIEVGTRPLIEYLGEKGAARPLSDDSDDRIGYLIDGNEVFVFVSGGEEELPASIGPFYYTKGFAGHAPRNLSRAQQCGLMTGYNTLDRSEFLSVIEHWRPRILSDYLSAMKPELEPKIVTDCAGELRTLWGLLLLMNQPRHYNLKETPRSVKLVKGKRVVYQTYNTVRINLNSMKEITKTLERQVASVGPRRRHDVAANFAHYHLGEGCVHEWSKERDETAEDCARWSCAHCGGVRVRRRAHQRGDASLGWVNKQYLVKE